jgi:hypothetical protein
MPSIRGLPLLLVAGLSAAGEALPEIPGLKGAIAIPVAMPRDGTAIIVLSTPQGQQVRTLAQVVPLKAGSYFARHC